MVSEEITKKSAKTKSYREIPIKNPFIRENKIWDSENELFDKIKVSLRGELYNLSHKLSKISLRSWKFLICVSSQNMLNEKTFV